jgi:DNA-binding Xre family transcriptional regulator
MAWRYLLEDQLSEFNQGRVRRGRQPLRWPDVSFMIGVSRQALQNLASNRELKVTNTRLLDSLCRFFNCKLTDLMVPVPEPEGLLGDDELDRLIALKERMKEDGVPERDFALINGDRPPCHIDVLYDTAVRKEWKGSQGKDG